MNKNDEIRVRTTPEFKAAAIKAAEAQGRTLSNLIEWLLRQEIEKPPK